jgi:hypothetical protein
MSVSSTWVYKVNRDAQTPEELETLLNSQGAEGWHLVSIHFPAPTANGFRNPMGPITVVLERPEQ